MLSNIARIREINISRKELSNQLFLRKGGLYTYIEFVPPAFGLV